MNKENEDREHHGHELDIHPEKICNLNNENDVNEYCKHELELHSDKEIDSTKSTIAATIDEAEEKAHYDAACKQILAEKIILAWIMKHVMWEYASMSVQEISDHYIIGGVQISKSNERMAELLQQTPRIMSGYVNNEQKSVDEQQIRNIKSKVTDDTNGKREQHPSKISTVGVEDTNITDGSITYDVKFQALLPENMEQIAMIINVEAQNKFHMGYPLTKRGVYYCGRMISSQQGTIFVNSHYENLQKVYSIWICIDAPNYRKNTITGYSLTEQNYVGDVHENQADYDLISLIMICLGNYQDAEKKSLLRLLDVLFHNELDVESKKQILEEE